MTILSLALIDIDAILLVGNGRMPAAALLPSTVALLVMAAGLAIAAMSPAGTDAATDRDETPPPPLRGRVVRRFGAPRARRAT